MLDSVGVVMMQAAANAFWNRALDVMSPLQAYVSRCSAGSGEAPRRAAVASVCGLALVDLTVAVHFLE